MLSELESVALRDGPNPERRFGYLLPGTPTVIAAGTGLGGL
jgi:hypothetical protein